MAVTVDPLDTPTFFTTIVCPLLLVTLTSTVGVPYPLEFSKKLYCWRVVDSQLLPPSTETSSLETGSLEFMTCMENQFGLVPSLFLRTMGDVMPQATTDQETGMGPSDWSASAEKASGKRSRWLVPQPGHWSTIYIPVSYIDGLLTVS